MTFQDDGVAKAILDAVGRGRKYPDYLYNDVRLQAGAELSHVREDWQLAIKELVDSGQLFYTSNGRLRKAKAKDRQTPKVPVAAAH